MTRPIVLIAAVGRNRVIGQDGAMPWSLPGDLAHFREATMGKPVVLGRKTCEAIGRALPGRPMVVLSRDPAHVPSYAEPAASPEAAIARADALAGEMGAAEIMVAGGGAVYAALLPRAAFLLITEVDLAPEGDTLFPAIDPAVWREIARVPTNPAANDSASYTFVRYQRAEPGGR